MNHIEEDIRLLNFLISITPKEHRAYKPLNELLQEKLELTNQLEEVL